MKKKNEIDICFFERIVMPSFMFMIPSVASCKLPSPLIWDNDKELEIPGEYILYGN